MEYSDDRKIAIGNARRRPGSVTAMSKEEMNSPTVGMRRPPSEIDRETHSLAATVASLILLSGDLHNRLQPVLSPSEPHGSVDEERAPGPRTDIGRFLREEVDKLQSVSSVIREILGRIEI